MKYRRLISEGEENRILSLYTKKNELIFESNYRISDIKKVLNDKYGGKFNSNPYNDKFGNITSDAIVSALDKVKTSGVSGGATVTTSTVNQSVVTNTGQDTGTQTNTGQDTGTQTNVSQTNTGQDTGTQTNTGQDTGTQTNTGQDTGTQTNVNQGANSSSEESSTDT